MADDQALATCFELGFGNFFTGCRSTPGIMPATKQLDLLISEAARSRPPGTKEELQHGDLLAKKIDRIRWRAWHGRPLGALDLIDELLEELEMPNRQIQLTAVYIKSSRAFCGRYRARFNRLELMRPRDALPNSIATLEWCVAAFFGPPSSDWRLGKFSGPWRPTMKNRPTGSLQAHLGRKIPHDAQGTVMFSYRLLASNRAAPDRLDVRFTPQLVIWGAAAEDFEEIRDIPERTMQ